MISCLFTSFYFFSIFVLLSSETIVFQWVAVALMFCGALVCCYAGFGDHGSQPSGKGSKGDSPAPDGAQPPPSPPPAYSMVDFAKCEASAGGGDKYGRQALFAALNKGKEITSGLNKLTSENPNLRAASTDPAKAAGMKSPTDGGGQQKTGVTGDQPPRLELKDHQLWQIDHKENRQIQLQVDMKETLGAMPIVVIQKTDGCQVYLNKDAIGAEIVTSKFSEMNILVPKTDADGGDFI